MASNIQRLTPSRNLLFTTEIFPATFVTPAKVSEHLQNTGLGEKAADSGQAQARRISHQMEGRIFWSSSWGITSALPTKQDYPESPFSAFCLGQHVSLGTIISVRTAFRFSHPCVRWLRFYRCLATLRREYLLSTVFFVQLVLLHLFQSPKPGTIISNPMEQKQAL